MTTDERLHYLGGWFKGLAIRARYRWPVYRYFAIHDLDRWAWDREVRQHDPNLTPHQVAEARAWGAGARRACGVDGLRWPVPPYPSPRP